MISIIGSGKVGSATAFLCASYGIDNITLVNRHEQKAKGEALDISNTIPATSKISINGTDNYSNIQGSDVVVIAASKMSHMQSRAELMSEHTIMIKDIAKNVAKYAPNATVLMVTNPVDVLTYAFHKGTSMDSKKIIGVASSLDSSRFRYVLSKELGTDQSQITDAIVMGEHDDSMVPIFSHAKFAGQAVSQILDEEKKSKVTLEVRNYWKYLRDYKGSSVFGIAKNTFDIIKCMKQNESIDATASVLLKGQYGFSDVCLGVPLSIDKNGVTKIHEIQITESEQNDLHKSADIVKKNISKVI